MQCLQASITWTECSPPPTPIASVQNTVINDKVYFHSGDSKHNTSICCYDATQDQWNMLPPLPVMEFGLGHINSTVVAVGGISTRKTKKQRCNELYILSHRSKWVTTLPPMPTARSLATVLSIESGLIVAGGQTDTELNTVAIEVFKRESAQWYKCEQISLPTACYNLSLTTSGDNLYITGGFGNRSLPLNQALSNFSQLSSQFCRVGCSLWHHQNTVETFTQHSSIPTSGSNARRKPTCYRRMGNTRNQNNTGSESARVLSFQKCLGLHQ